MKGDPVRDGGVRASRSVKRRFAMIGGAAVLLLVLTVLSIYFSLGKRNPEYPIDRTVRYRFEVRNDSSHVLKDVAFWALGPVARTAFQKSGKIEANHPFEQTRDGLGNEILHFRFDTLAPYASRQVTVTAHLNLAQEPQPLEGVKPADYLAAEKYMPVTDPQLIELAASLKGNGGEETARQTLEWVNKNIRYAGYTADRRGALYAFRSRSGDCTEYMDLFSALARIGGIPTRGLGGFVTSEDTLFRVANYHNWAEVYLDGRWQVADPQNGVFEQGPSRYIAMQVLGNPKGEKAPLSLFGSETPDLSMRML